MACHNLIFKGINSFFADLSRLVFFQIWRCIIVKKLEAISRIPKVHKCIFCKNDRRSFFCYENKKLTFLKFQQQLLLYPLKWILISFFFILILTTNGSPYKKENLRESVYHMVHVVFEKIIRRRRWHEINVDLETNFSNLIEKFNISQKKVIYLFTELKTHSKTLIIFSWTSRYLNISILQNLIKTRQTKRTACQNLFSTQSLGSKKPFSNKNLLKAVASHSKTEISKHSCSLAVREIYSALKICIGFSLCLTQYRFSTPNKFLYLPNSNCVTNKHLIKIFGFLSTRLILA